MTLIYAYFQLPKCIFSLAYLTARQSSKRRVFVEKQAREQMSPRFGGSRNGGGGRPNGGGRPGGFGGGRPRMF